MDTVVCRNFAERCDSNDKTTVHLYRNYPFSFSVARKATFIAGYGLESGGKGLSSRSV